MHQNLGSHKDRGELTCIGLTTGLELRGSRGVPQRLRGLKEKTFCGLLLLDLMGAATVLCLISPRVLQEVTGSRVYAEVGF